MIIIRLIRGVIFFFGLCSIIWLAGLVLFAERLQYYDAAMMDTDPAPVDAIVVLTGGPARLRTGLELLTQGKGKKLFISGVHSGLTLDQILAGQNVPDDLRSCCIMLGHAAESTEGNAEETQDWLELEGYHSLRLVTANYHMPRSLLLFRAVLPNIAITPHPIVLDNVKLNEWWRHAGTAGLLVTEYNKYLFAYASLRAGAL